MGTNDVVDKCGLGYQVGGYVGDVVNYSIQVLAVVGPLLEAGAAAAEAVEAVEAVETEAGLAADAETTAEEVASEAEDLESCALCFAAGTQVLTNNGPIAIEHIKVGDQVLSQSASTGKSEYKRVTALTRPHLDRLIELHIQDQREVLRPTPGHPFWAKHGDKAAGWIKAGNLQVGDFLLTNENKWSKVTAIDASEGQQTVYNFEVEDNHNYYVGIAGVLVHNEGPCNNYLRSRSEAFQDAKRANDIPTSQQPDLTIKSGTAEGDAAGLDSRNVRQYEFTNSEGQKISIREDLPVDYGDGGPAQPPHFNSGPSGGDLTGHHYWPN
jgi:hypothetical protein